MPHYCNQVFSIEKDTTVYLFSDGYQDQFGGPDYDKFGMSQYENLITRNLHMPMKEQAETLSLVHESWRGLKNQTDDILVLGIRFS